MKPTAIIVTNYIGRPVTDKGIIMGTFSFDHENQTETYLSAEHPCPAIANTEPGETILAELKWQFSFTGEEDDWHDTDNRAYKSYKDFEDYSNSEMYSQHRQIWVPIVEQKEGEGNEPPIIQRLDKVEQTVSELILLVSELAIAIRKIFETQ
jgi:hypothetical protein